MTNDYKQPDRPKREASGALPDPVPPHTYIGGVRNYDENSADAPVEQPDEPEPPATPGDADLSPEQIAAELNRRKWRERDDWHFSIAAARYESLANGFHSFVQMDCARALVAGWKAQDELAVQRMNTDSDRAYIASLEARLAALTAENQRLREWISTQALHSSTLHSAQHAIEQRLAAQPPAQPDLDAIEARKEADKQLWKALRAFEDHVDALPPACCKPVWDERVAPALANWRKVTG